VTFATTARFASRRTYIDQVLADSPILFLPFKELSGTTAEDISGNNRDGTISGATLGATGLLSGEPDTSFDFDGSNDYVRLADAAWLDFSGDVTIEAWCEPDSISSSSGAQFLWGRHQGATHGRHTRLRFNDQQPQFSVYVGGSVYIARASDVTAGSIYHVVGTYDSTSGDVRVYVNGNVGTVEQPTVSGGGSIDSSTQPVYIGANVDDPTSTAKEFFDGLIGNVAVFDSVLSTSRISAHYSAGT